MDEGLDPEEKKEESITKKKKCKDPRGQPWLIDSRQQANASNAGIAILNEKIQEDNNLHRASPYMYNIKRKEKTHRMDRTGTMERKYWVD